VKLDSYQLSGGYSFEFVSWIFVKFVHPCAQKAVCLIGNGVAKLRDMKWTLVFPIFGVLKIKGY
jgi:hypothetical protein